MPTPRTTILVVDDNTDVLLALSSMLEQLGFDVQTAENAAAALAIFQGNLFSVIVSDISMPGEMNGIELAKALRRIRPDLQIVLMTGYSEYLEEAKREFAVLQKPFDVAALKAVLPIET